MKKVWIHGITGRMGSSLAKLVKESDKHVLVGGSSEERGFGEISQAEYILDFSSAAGNLSLLQELNTRELVNKRLIIGATGIDGERERAWGDFADNFQSVQDSFHLDITSSRYVQIEQLIQDDGTVLAVGCSNV
mgnify:CR=1 FL=1